ncbi:MAG TPA: hypothetical protein VFE51_27625 [Verrucomicrobiae bacterium]|nr:hypothetical protein [Verrucomicrobiae bacterium]
MAPFIFLAKQLDRLERERTEVPHRKRHYGGMWLGVPILFATAFPCIKYHHQALDTASPFALWVGFVLIASVLAFAGVMYQNRVAIKAQLFIDLIAWSVLIWMIFHFRFWEP